MGTLGYGPMGGPRMGYVLLGEGGAYLDKGAVGVTSA